MHFQDLLGNTASFTEGVRQQVVSGNLLLCGPCPTSVESEEMFTFSAKDIERFVLLPLWEGLRTMANIILMLQ